MPAEPRSFGWCLRMTRSYCVLHGGGNMLRIDPGVKEELLERIEKRSQEKSPSGVVKVTSRVIHHFQMRAEADGFAFISDEGERVGGYGAGPAPLRYFLAGVMMCHQVWCVKAAALLDVKLDSVEGSIAGHMPADGAYSKEDVENAFEKISYEVVIGSLHEPAEVIAVVEKAGLRCPAYGTIRLAVPIDLKIVHNGKVVLEKNLPPTRR
jgi:uncharacterized OsmC-like protein